MDLIEEEAKVNKWIQQTKILLKDNFNIELDNSSSEYGEYFYFKSHAQIIFKNHKSIMKYVFLDFWYDNNKDKFCVMIDSYTIHNKIYLDNSKAAFDLFLIIIKIYYKQSIKLEEMRNHKDETEKIS